MIITPADIVSEARNLLGVPWVHQGMHPEFGIDCRGMLLVIADRLGYLFRDYSKTYRRRSPAVELRVALLDEFDLIWQREADEVHDDVPDHLLQASDVVLIRFPRDDVARHVGIIADGIYERTIIHAYEPAFGGGKVVEEPFRRWKPHVVALFRWQL